jgi:hypothetical protein
VQRGQVGQPSPDDVSRTAPPVTTMAVLATTLASASRRTVLGVGRDRRARTTSIYGAAGGSGAS